MLYVVSFSGGIGSFCAAHRIKERLKDGDTVRLVFTDTLIEDEDLYRFMREAAKVLELELVELRDGRNPWEVFKDVKFQGNSRVAPCSRILKREVMTKYLNALTEPYVLVLGIDYEEEHRLKTAQKNNPGVTVIAPLCDKPLMGHTDRLKLIEKYGLKLPSLYEKGFAHNNCGGFCVRAGMGQFALLLEKFPERYEWHNEQQKKLKEQVPNVRAFLQKNVDNVKYYLTLEEFKKMELTKQEKKEMGGCGCFIDDGGN